MVSKQIPSKKREESALSSLSILYEAFVYIFLKSSGNAFLLNYSFFVLFFIVAVGMSVVGVILTGMGALFGFYVHTSSCHIQSSMVSNQIKLMHSQITQSEPK